MASNLPTQLLVKGVQALEKFTGADDQDPSDWLQEIDELFEAGKVDKSDRRRVLLTLFGTDVKNWYRSEEVSTDYDMFKQEFIKTFTSPGYRLKIYSKIINRRQRPDEATQSYYYDVLSLCSKLNPEMSESEKILHLLRGLKTLLLQRVMMYDSSSCKELLQYAKRADVVEDITQSPPTVSTAITTTVEITETTAALRQFSTNKNHPAGQSSGYQQQPSNYQQQRSSLTYSNNNQQFHFQRSNFLKYINAKYLGHPCSIYVGGRDKIIEFENGK